MNWQVLAQLISIGAVLLAGPAVVVLLLSLIHISEPTRPY